MVQLDYPSWLRILHWVNVLFITLLIRSGIEILSCYPKLFRRPATKPGTEWARFSRKRQPKDKLFDALDQEESYHPFVALPGRRNLGMGRHWHFVSAVGWFATGASYWALLFATGQWHRYIPYSWRIFPEAWNDILTYLSFNLPPLLPGRPLDAIQTLTYAAVIFLLAPFQIITAAAQAPAVEAHFPWFVRLMGGRQGARTLHFFGLIAFCGFIAIHILMIGVWGYPQLVSLMILGRRGNLQFAFWLSIAILIAIIIVHTAATIWSLRAPRQVQSVLGTVIMAGRKVLLRPMVSRQNWDAKWTSQTHGINGKPPDSDEYKLMAVHDFVDWRLEVGGLVENPMTFTLADLRALRAPQTQRTQHNCIQGWSSIAQWGGLPMSTLTAMVKPLPEARYICFLTLQENDRDERSAEGTGIFYEVLDMKLAAHPQAILAYEMNGVPLPIKHGAPLRLRAETQVGFKMPKWIYGIEYVTDFTDIGRGKGGWREDNIYFDQVVGI